MNIVGPVWYRPSFLRGIGSIINLFGSSLLLRTAETPDGADAEAFHGDYEVLKHDFEIAISQIEDEIAALRFSDVGAEE